MAGVLEDRTLDAFHRDLSPRSHQAKALGLPDLKEWVAAAMVGGYFTASSARRPCKRPMAVCIDETTALVAAVSSFSSVTALCITDSVRSTSVTAMSAGRRASVSTSSRHAWKTFSACRFGVEARADARSPIIRKLRIELSWLLILMVSWDVS